MRMNPFGRTQDRIAEDDVKWLDTDDGFMHLLCPRCEFRDYSVVDTASGRRLTCLNCGYGGILVDGVQLKKRTGNRDSNP